MAAALLLAGDGMLSSCSQDEPGGQGTPLPDGQYPLQLSASVAEAVSTRAAGKDGWTGDGTEEIAASVDGTTYKYRITDTGGATEFADTQEPFYWQNTAQTANIEAWYPYDTRTDIDITRQNEMTDLSEIDFLKADRVENVNYQTQIALTFRHQMAKVSYTLIPGDGVTENDLANATVSIAGHTQASFSEGTLTGSGDGWITPTADGEVLLVPQDMSGKEFIKVSINGNEFFYTPGAGAANLQPGTHYTYTITVRKDRIEVTGISASWNDDITEGPAGEATFRVHLSENHGQTLSYSNNVTEKDDYLEVTGNPFTISYTVTDANQMKGFPIAEGIGTMERTASGNVYIFTYTLRSDVRLTYGDYAQAGDYYYSDGTWHPDYKADKTCIGIVFKSGSGEGDDVSAYGGTPSSIHGYVVALADAHHEAGAWGIRTTDVSGLTNEGSYTPIYNGYANTAVVRELSAYSSTDVSQPTTNGQYWAFKVASEYNVSVPQGSSGWYLPSIGQLNDIYNLPDRAALFTTAGGTDFKTSDNNGRYWSSTEMHSYDAWYYQFNGSGAGAYAKSNDGGNYLQSSYVRSVLTF